MPRVPTDPAEPKDDPTPKPPRRQGLAYQGASEAVVSILIAVGFGYWLDGRFDTSPIFLVLGTALGFAAFVLRLLRLGRQLQQRDARENFNEPQP